MREIKADLLPVISEEWGQEKEGEEVHYLSPLPKRCHKWIKHQKELFQKDNPINACDIKGKMSPYNTRVYFNQPNLTGFGGMPLLISFIEKMEIEESLEEVFDHEGYIYSTSDLLLSAITGITVGVDRLYHLNAIRDDAALTKALGLDQLPEESNLRRQLTQASTREVERMRTVISKNLAKANQTEETVEIGLDIDSTVATVYGKQEGAEVGYNPKKRGRPSYSIKTAFIANNGDCVNLRLDGGKSHSKKGFKEFFEKAVSLLPSNYKVVFVRLDKGYFGENTFEYLEKEGIRYVAASKNTRPLRKRVASLSDNEWQELEKDSLYLTEIEYAYHTWKKRRRMIIKKSLSPNPNYDEKERDIFGNPLEPPFTVEYSFYVTNIPQIELDKLPCYRFYNNRATVETRIKEQKLGFNLDKLPVHNKEGNEVYILLVALAYNILNWFKRFLLPEEFRSRCIKWIRMYLLNLPALIQRKKKQYFIKFSKFYPYRELFEYIFRELARGKPYYVV